MKKIGLILVGAALAAGTIINVNLNSQRGGLSDISLANVEALTTEYDKICFKLVSSECSISCNYEYCGYCYGRYLLECED
jgi:hypothetical protein